MKYWKSLSGLVICALTVNTLSAQSIDDIELPRTNIVIAEMKYNNGNFDFWNLKQVASEEDCYENQPRFTIDGRHVLFSKEYKTKQKRKQPPIITTEICQYKVNGGRVERLTKTREYEFSPQESKYISQITAVQLNEEGEQYIVKYNERGDFERDEKLNGETVGYYSWVNDQNILIYALPDPAVLKWVNIYTGQEEVITAKIGHTIEFFERDNGIYYVDKGGDTWSIQRLYLQNLEAGPEKVIDLLPGVEDFTMLNDGSFISSQEGKLYHFAPDKMGEFNGKEMENWRMIADLDRLDMPTRITRLAVNPENSAIVMVVDEEDEWYDTKYKRK